MNISFLLEYLVLAIEKTPTRVFTVQVDAARLINSVRKGSTVLVEKLGEEHRKKNLCVIKYSV